MNRRDLLLFNAPGLNLSAVQNEINHGIPAERWHILKFQNHQTSKHSGVGEKVSQSIHVVGKMMYVACVRDGQYNRTLLSHQNSILFEKELNRSRTEQKQKRGK